MHASSYELLSINKLAFYRLFPIRETGMNFHAQELQMHEIEVCRPKIWSMITAVYYYACVFNVTKIVVHVSLWELNFPKSSLTVCMNLLSRTSM